MTAFGDAIGKVASGAGSNAGKVVEVVVSNASGAVSWYFFADSADYVAFIAEGA